jgi:hypothetical protein
MITIINSIAIDAVMLLILLEYFVSVLCFAYQHSIMSSVLCENI